MIKTIELKQFGLKKQTVFRDNFHTHRIRAISKVICEDGSQRFCKIVGEPTTWFSIPAKVNVNKTSVTGFVIAESLQGYETPRPDDPMVYKFIAYKYNKNWRLVNPLKEG
jgi:hypothetical protein